MSNERQFKFLFIFLSIKCVESVLVFPQFTVLQLVASISVPIVDLPPERKVFFDWGLQMNYDMPFNVSSFHMTPIWATNGTSRMFNEHILTGGVRQLVLTANELYKGFENMLERYGYDRSCSKRSICELSRHPIDETSKNVVTDVIEFLLTPSIHRGFPDGEKYDEYLYKLAENQGFRGENCQELYPKCVESIFDILTINITDSMRP